MTIKNLKELDFFQIINDNGITFFQILSSKFKMTFDIDFVGMIISAIQSFGKEVFKTEIREIVLKNQVIQLKTFEYKNNLDIVFKFIAVLGYSLENRDITDYSFKIEDNIVIDILNKINTLHLLDNYENSNSFEYKNIFKQIEPIFYKIMN